MLKVRVTATHHIAVAASLPGRISAKFDRLGHYADDLEEIAVTIDRDVGGFHLHARLRHARGPLQSAHAHGRSLAATVDGLYRICRKQLRRRHRLQVVHHRGGI